MKHTTHSTQHTRTALLTLGIAALAVPTFGQSFIPPQPDWTPEVPESFEIPALNLGALKPYVEDKVASRLEQIEQETVRIRSARFPERLSDYPQPPEWLEIQRLDSVVERGFFENAVQEARGRMFNRLEQAAAQGLDAVPGHYKVAFRDSAFPYAAEIPERPGQRERVNTAGETLELVAHRLVTDAGGELTSVWNYALPGFAAYLTPEAAQRLETVPQVRRITPDGIGGPDAAQTINEPGLWGLDRIDEHNISNENVYRYHSTGGTGVWYPGRVHAYVLDSGLRATHDEFNAGSDWTFVGNGESFTTPTTNDLHGHGTMVSGVLCGVTYGVAKMVSLHPVKVLFDNGFGSSSLLIDGMEWVLEQHVSGERAVVNISLRFPGDDLIDDAVENLHSAGIVVICSGGNDNESATLHSPRRAENALAIGAITDSDAKWFWSNWGPKIHVWAPGVDVLTADVAHDSSTITTSGTSFAAPHTAGVAARYLQKHPTASPDDVADWLRGAAVEDKILGNLQGADNLLLHFESWWYPFNTQAEWINSDVPYTDDHWFYSNVFSTWMWTGNHMYNGVDDKLPVYHHEDDKWLIFLDQELIGGWERSWVFYDMSMEHYVIVFPFDDHWTLDLPWL